MYIYLSIFGNADANEILTRPWHTEDGKVLMAPFSFLLKNWPRTELQTK